MPDKDEILDRFRSVELKDEGWARAHTFETQLRDVAEVLLRVTKPGRAQAVALTKLEEAKMWAFRAVAEDQINGEHA